MKEMKTNDVGGGGTALHSGWNLRITTTEQSRALAEETETERQAPPS